MTDPSALDDWVADLAAELGMPDLDVDIPLILDLARDSAHAVARPAAPLTAFVVGYVAGRRGGSPEEVRAAVETATRLALARG